jgi:hypothetical protein
VQRTKRYRVRLLIILVLFSLVVTSARVTSLADAQGRTGPAATVSDVVKPGATITSGDPDAGSGVVPPPPDVKLKRLHAPPGPEAGRPASFDWVRWISRIWATLHSRAAD